MLAVDRKAGRSYTEKDLKGKRGHIMTKVRHVRNSVRRFHRDVDRLQWSEKGDFDLTILEKAWWRNCSVLKVI